MDVIKRIERGVKECQELRGMVVSIKDLDELLHLAKIGQVYLDLLNECADVIKLCHDESCKSNMYCKAYRARVIE